MIDVFEHDLARVKVGQGATVTVSAYPDERFNGTVASVGDIVDPTTRTLRARIDVANPGHRLKPGMFANAEIATAGAAGAVLSVPSSAIFNLGGKDSTFVAMGRNRFTVTSVETGAAGEDQTQITSGLHEGDEIVVEGGLLLKAMTLNQASAH